MAEFYCIIMNTDQHIFCRKSEDKLSFFFSCTIWNSPKHNLPLSMSHQHIYTHNSYKPSYSTTHYAALSQLSAHKYYYSYNFSPVTPTVQFTAVCSVNSLRSKKTVKAQSWTLFVSPFSLAVPIIATCCDVTTSDRTVKTFQYPSASNNLNCRPHCV